MAFVTLKFEVRKRRDVLSASLARRLGDRELRDMLTVMAERTKRYAIDLAHERLVTDRPPARRREPDKPRYVDAFDTTRFEVSGGRARITVVNTHHFARGIENGSPEHEITSEGIGAFPLDTLRGGNYSSTAPPYKVYGIIGKPAIDHPGSDGVHICRDAADWAQETFRAEVQLTLVPAR